MATANSTPDTLLGAITYFADVDAATMFVASLRWPNGVACPHCEGKDCAFVASRRIWQCKACRKQFSGKVGVMGLLGRHGDNGGSQVRLEVIKNRKKHQLEQTIGVHVADGATLYTDALRSYDRMQQRGFVHHVIDHAEAYVDGEVHTNG